MFNSGRYKKQILPQNKVYSRTRPFPEIKHFPGNYMPETSNILDLPIGSLINNKNCEYGVHEKFVYTKTRRGSTVVCDSVNGSFGMCLANYNGNQYIFWIDALTGVLKYTIGDLGVVYSTTKAFALTESDMFFYNHPTTPALYVCNLTDGIFRVGFTAGPTITVTAVAGSPKISRMAFSHISGRMFGVDAGHTVYYTAIQQMTAVDTSNLETWNTATQFAIVSPDAGEGFRAIIDDGNAMYFIKDIGVWCLPNANEATSEWIIPKLKIGVGCSAPKTVHLLRFSGQTGIVFLANDNTLRFFTGSVERNAGTLPTFTEGDSLILSSQYKDKLEKMSRGGYIKSTAAIYEQMYILSYASDSSANLNEMLVVDLEKGKEYWFDYENYVCTNFVRTKDYLYGYDSRGFIVKLFINNKVYDEIPSRLTMYSNDIVDSSNANIKRIAIRWSFYTSWFKVSDYLQRLVSGYVNYSASGGQPLAMRLNSFTKGDIIPEYDEGILTYLVSRVSGAAYWDSAIWDQSRFTKNENQQTNAGSCTNGEGNYFNFGFYSSVLYQSATVYSLQFNFNQLRSTPNVSN